MVVRDQFAGKNIFLTGGTGFLGKALIEKVLRTIPEIGTIYLLVRNKKDKTPSERVKDIFEDCVSTYYTF